MSLGLVITWAIITIVLICVEIASVQLVAIWFAAGGLAAFIASLFGAELFPTLYIFIIVSIILLLCTRPFVKKYLTPKKVATNADSIIGMICIVSEKVENLSGSGRILVNGLSWAAKSVVDELSFDVDEKAKIVAIEGVKAVIEKT